MSLVKRFSVLLMAVFLIVNISACHLMDDRAPKQKIFEFVNDNQQKLSAFVEEYEEPSYEYFQKEFETVRVVKGVFKDQDNEIIDFYCGGTGNATNSTYVGFYFVADNVPYSPCFGKVSFTAISDGIYEWQDERGLHKSHIERICDNWFYYDEQYY